MSDFRGAMSDALSAIASAPPASQTAPAAAASPFSGAIADANDALAQGKPFGSLTAAAPYGATDALVHGATLGLSEPVAALATATGRYLKGQGFDFPEAMRERNAGRAAYEAGNPATNVALNLLGGGAVAPSAAAGGSGLAALARGVGLGAGAGAVSGAANNAQSPTDALKGAGEGAALGGALGAIAPAVAGAVMPRLSPAVSTLRAAGINMTPGQMLGGTANTLEQASQSLPVAGDFIKNARRAAVTDFNRAAVNQALAPIGETLQAEPGTREAVAEMQNKIGDAYTRVVPSLGWGTASPAVSAMQNGLARLRNNAAVSLPPAMVKTFNDDLDRLVLQRMSPGGGITGESFQEAKSDLGKRAIDLASNPNNGFWEKRLAGAFFQAQQTMRDAQNVADPAAGAALSSVDNAFAHSLRINNAAGRTGASEPGLFTPVALQNATKALDPSLRKKAFAAGDALMQNFAEAGKSVLGNSLPDSGTPYRTALRTLGGLGMGAMGMHAAEGSVLPEGAMGYAAPVLAGYGGLSALAGLLYSPLGRRVMAGALTARPPGAGQVAAAIPGLVPGAAGLLAPQQ